MFAYVMHNSHGSSDPSSTCLSSVLWNCISNPNSSTEETYRTDVWWESQYRSLLMLLFLLQQIILKLQANV